MKKTYQLSVGFNLATKGNYPLVQHPEVNSWIGWEDKQLLVDEMNQALFTAPYELEDGLMKIISPVFDDNTLVVNTKSNGQLALKVDYASIFTVSNNTDQTAIISLNALLNVSANDEDEAYTIATNLVNKDNISIDELIFHDELTGKIYNANVLKIEVDIDDTYIRELEEEVYA